LDDEFGMPADKKTYRRITVFDSDEDLEEWERDQLAQQSSLRADGDEPSAVAGAVGGAGAASRAVAVGGGDN
jgi:hypothetical protein